MDVSEVKGFTFGPHVGEQEHEELEASVSNPRILYCGPLGTG